MSYRASPLPRLSAMDPVLVLLAIGGIAVCVAALALLLKERSRARDAGLEGARREQELAGRLSASERERETSALALSTMEEGVLLFGADGATRLANPAVEGHLGVRPASTGALLPLGLRQLTERAAAAQAVLAADAEIGAPARTPRRFAAPTEAGVGLRG